MVKTKQKGAMAMARAAAERAKASADKNKGKRWLASESYERDLINALYRKKLLVPARKEFRFICHSDSDVFRNRQLLGRKELLPDHLNHPSRYMLLCYSQVIDHFF